MGPLAHRPSAGGGTGLSFRAHTNPAVPVLCKLPDVCAQGAAPSLHQRGAQAAALEQTMPKRFVKSAAAWFGAMRSREGGEAVDRQGLSRYMQTDAHTHKYIHTYMHIRKPAHAYIYMHMHI